VLELQQILLASSLICRTHQLIIRSGSQEKGT